jgi:glutamyl-Q tRNA(Asp) synthetase
MRYVGRFAPSPTGPLHAGSLVAALGSWLDARAAGGRWLVRIEDLDGPRCVAGAAELILEQLARCGLVADMSEGPNLPVGANSPDAAPWRQSTRDAAYAQVLAQLRAAGLAYDCGCTRREIDDLLAVAGQMPPRHGERIYPGTCRGGLNGKAGRAVRLLTLREGQPVVIHWADRRLGPQRQNVTDEVGDFVLKRADGLWAYQLAVVVDDAAQGITHVVRGEDLADNTARQILLQRDLGFAAPAYLHLPLVRGADGEKLSKQNGAVAVDLTDPVAALRAAARVLGLPDFDAATPAAWLARAVPAWAGIIAAPDTNKHSSRTPS